MKVVKKVVKCLSSRSSASGKSSDLSKNDRPPRECIEMLNPQTHFEACNKLAKDGKAADTMASHFEEIGARGSAQYEDFAHQLKRAVLKREGWLRDKEDEGNIDRIKTVLGVIGSKVPHLRLAAASLYRHVTGDPEPEWPPSLSLKMGHGFGTSYFRYQSEEGKEYATIDDQGAIWTWAKGGTGALGVPGDGKSKSKAYGWMRTDVKAWNRLMFYDPTPNVERAPSRAAAHTSESVPDHASEHASQGSSEHASEHASATKAPARKLEPWLSEPPLVSPVMSGGLSMYHGAAWEPSTSNHTQEEGEEEDERLRRIVDGGGDWFVDPRPPRVVVEGEGQDTQSAEKEVPSEPEFSPQSQPPGEP